MARRGRFGRLPRQAPDLSGAIAALMREAQNQYDQNMVDAWKNGGEVDGEAVTDNRLLAHFKKRRDELDPDDPLWTEWNNRIDQYEFRIDESKLMVKWENGDATQSQVAKFYRDWANKTPKDTEFYRTLMQSAGKWQQAADAAGRGGRARGEAEAHQKWADAYYKKNVRPGEIASVTLLQAAIQFGAAPANANDLSDLNPNSPAYDKFLDMLEDGQTDDPTVQRILNQGLADIKALRPDFEWTKSGIAGLQAEAIAGGKVLQKKSRTDTERKYWTGVTDDINWSQNRTAEVDPLKIATDAADSFQTEFDRCAGETACQTDALTKFHRQLSKAEPALLVTGEEGFTGPMSSVIANTRRQVEDILNGKPQDEAGIGATNIFDLQMGADSSFGEKGMAGWGNKFNEDKAKLLDGGFVIWAGQPDSKGNLAVDDDGTPILTQTVVGKDTPPPANTFRVDGATAVPKTPEQSARDAEAAYIAKSQGRDPGFIAPDIHVRGYVEATPVYVTGASGGNLTTGSVAGVTPTDPKETQGAYVGYQILKVPNADKSGWDTIYVTGNGTAETPYLYHQSEPKYTNGVTMTVNGQRTVVVPASPTTDKNGVQNGYSITPENNWDQTIRHRNTDGYYDPGTYKTPAGASIANFITKTYESATPGTNSDQITTAVINKLAIMARQAYANGEDAYAADLQADRIATQQMRDLTRDGKTGSVMTNSFKDKHSYDEKDSQYANALTRAGLTPQSVGKAEFDRRIGLLKDVEEYESQTTPGLAYRGAPGKYGEGDKTATAAQLRSMISDPNEKLYNLNIPGVRNLALENAMGQAAGGVTGFLAQGFGAPFKAVAGLTNIGTPSKAVGHYVPATTGAPPPGAPSGGGWSPSVFNTPGYTPPPAPTPSYIPPEGFGLGKDYKPPESYSAPYKPYETPPLVRPGEAAKPY